MGTLPSAAVNIYDPVIPVSQGIYEESSTQKAKLGTRLRVGEKTFYYAQLSTSANVKAGDVLCAPQLIASHQSGIITASAAITGQSTITVTMGTAVTANQYAEGYINISDVTSGGGGLHFKIKSHPVISTAATGVITLYDAVPYAIDAGPCGLVPSPFSAIKVGSAVLDTPVGVAPIAVTTGNYFWVQTWGPASPKHSAATPAAAAIAMATLGMVGACRADTEGGGATKFEIGKNSNLAATATECNPVILTILP